LQEEAVRMRTELLAAGLADPGTAPVEYAVAVQRYLEQASLSPASRRVYGISLASWAWPLVGRATPPAGARRGSRPPAVPLARLDAADTPGRLAAAVARRARQAGPRTLNRELSALRSAAGWWLDQGWIGADPVAGLSLRAHGQAALPPLTGPQVAAVFGLRASLREQALWRLLYDSGWPAGLALALDASAVDLAARGGAPGTSAGRDGARPGRAAAGAAGADRPWQRETADLISWLLVGRRSGPLFLTDRKAPPRVPAADVCPVTGRARMSYRRAAEIFTGTTRVLDPSGRGWTLHQLTAAGGPPRAAG
jgi:integrase